MYFVERFPSVVEAGRGSDWPYAGWYMEMLRLTHPDQFPYAVGQGQGTRCICADCVSGNGPLEVADPAATTR